MASINPLLQAASKNKAVKKGAPVSAKQAAGLANFLKNKKSAKAAPVDAEDLADGGIDEAEEKE